MFAPQKSNSIRFPSTYKEFFYGMLKNKEHGSEGTILYKILKYTISCFILLCWFTTCKFKFHVFSRDVYFPGGGGGGVTGIGGCTRCARIALEKAP